MPNREIRNERENVERRTVREADRETRRRMIEEHLRKARQEQRAGLYQGRRRQKPEPKAEDNPTRDLSAATAARRIRTRREVIEDAVAEAVGNKPARK